MKFRLLLLVLVGLVARVAHVEGQGGEENLPPAMFRGLLTAYPPLPPPPVQPATSVQTRVVFTTNELDQIVLRLTASGTPGSGLLVGIVRPGTSRPVVMTTGMLDADGHWSFERVLTAPQARALNQSELVFVSL